MASGTLQQALRPVVWADMICLRALQLLTFTNIFRILMVQLILCSSFHYPLLMA